VNHTIESRWVAASQTLLVSHAKLPVAFITVTDNGIAYGRRRVIIAVQREGRASTVQAGLLFEMESSRNPLMVPREKVDSCIQSASSPAVSS
jgi:hypothetical protein